LLESYADVMELWNFGQLVLALRLQLHAAVGGCAFDAEQQTRGHQLGAIENHENTVRHNMIV
jgi:hypothetical protein